MKKLLFVLYSITCFGQAPNIEWQKSLGGSNIDGAYSVKQTSDNGYIIAGMTRSNNGNVTGLHGYNDFWVVKLNNIGNLLWQKALGGSGNDQVFSLDETSDGGFIIGGVTDADGGDVSGTHGNSDFWVVKLNSSGTLVWQKAFGGTNNEVVNSIKQTSDGGYIVGGYTNSTDGNLINTGTRVYPDAWIIKLDANGNIEWQKIFGGTDYEIIYSIEQTSDNGYILACHSESHDNGVIGVQGGQDFWILKLDSLGILEWQKAIGGSSLDIPRSIKQTSDLGYIIAGYTLSNNGNITRNQGSYDYWIVKLNVLGELQWQKTLGGTNGDQAFSVDETSDGGYILAGKSSSNDGDVSNNYGLSDFWIVKLDNSGVLQWEKSIGGSNDDTAFSIEQTDDNGFIVAGFSKSTNGNVTGNHGSDDVWIVKLSPELLSVSNFQKDEITVFPNPTRYQLNILSLNKLIIDKIIITDMLGKIIFQQNGNSTPINTQNFTNGIYIIKIYSEEKIYLAKFIKE